MAEADKAKAIENVLAQIEKQFGKGAIMQLGQGSTADIQGIPTGALSLDIALGGRGLPRGVTKAGEVGKGSPTNEKNQGQSPSECRSKLSARIEQ